MMLHRSHPLYWLAFTTTLLASSSQALVGPSRSFRPPPSMVAVTASVSDEPALGTSASNPAETSTIDLSHRAISNLRFRELKRHLQERGLEDEGTTAQLRSRLRTVLFPGDECFVGDDGEEECGPEGSVSFCCVATIVWFLLLSCLMLSDSC